MSGNGDSALETSVYDAQRDVEDLKAEKSEAEWSIDKTKEDLRTYLKQRKHHEPLSEEDLALHVRYGLYEHDKVTRAINNLLIQQTASLLRVTERLAEAERRRNAVEAAALDSGMSHEKALQQLAKELRIEAFNEDRTSSTKASALWNGVNLEEEVCHVCGKSGNLSRAHIVRTREDCEAMGLSYEATSNMIILCGVKHPPHGQLPEDFQCHALFDLYLMGFLHVGEERDRHRRLWHVVGGGPKRHGKEVVLPTMPHRRALHAHLVRAVNQRSLLLPEDYHTEELHAWMRSAAPRRRKQKKVRKCENCGFVGHTAAECAQSEAVDMPDADAQPATDQSGDEETLSAIVALAHTRVSVPSSRHTSSHSSRGRGRKSAHTHSHAKPDSRHTGRGGTHRGRGSRVCRRGRGGGAVTNECWTITLTSE